MPYQIYESRESFYSKVRELTEISKSNNIFLNTKLEKTSRRDPKLLRWLKWLVSLLPNVHLAQTSPLKVAQEVAKFAEKHQKFLGKKDQLDLIEVVEVLKTRCHSFARGKEKKFDNVLHKIQTLVPAIEYSHTLCDLPQEIFEGVLSYIGSNDYENCMKVNTGWNQTIVKIAQRKEVSLVSHFIRFAMAHCGSQATPFLFEEKFYLRNFLAFKASAQPEKRLTYLKNIKNTLDFSKLTTIAQLKGHIYSEKIKFLIAVCSFYRRDLEVLNEQAKGMEFPWLFHDIFKPEINNQSYMLNGIAKLMEQGLYDKVAEIADLIDENHDSLIDLTLELALRKQLPQAIKIANRIHRDKREETFKSICILLIINDQCGAAIKVAKKVKRKDLLESICEHLLRFSSKLAEDKQFDKALAIANLIFDERIKDDAFSSISASLARLQHLEEATRIANMISHGYNKSFALSDISRLLAKTHQLDKALVVANAIPSKDVKSKVLVEIS
ncbi:hypothetical protein [Parachlamydia sp. AcF125]|uniref:hypothetical protein n=1 Tax=Parachlamydia sp. AcF125 TaxID=2795736 RepID=UPI001BC9DB33|nr:hypothetical protein [Parachlamydia sp. AcF125]MBS4168158.1 hypothetical protein [Parachlamydia sp. AcF125]